MKALLLSLTVLIVSSTALAISDAELKAACLETGKEKLAALAKANNCNVDLDEVVAPEVDNRWYNPSKYIWYAAQTDCNIDGVAQVMVQFSGGECF